CRALVGRALRHTVNRRALSCGESRRCLCLFYLLQYKNMKVVLQYPIAGKDARTIVESIEDGVRQGRIPHGASLPTVRALATSLNRSPTTIAAAYRMLRLRGVASAQGRGGTQVSARPPVLSRAAVSIPHGLRNLLQGSPDPHLLPDLRSFAQKL